MAQLHVVAGSERTVEEQVCQPTTGSPRLRSGGGIIGLALLAALACSDSGDPTGPPPPAAPEPAASITLSSGADQQGFAGEPLPNSVTVLVRTASNTRVVGERVRFTVTSGDGSVHDSIAVTGSSGIAGTTWILGPEVGTQELTVSLASGELQPLRVRASAIDPADADYLLVSNAGAGGVIALFVGYEPDNYYGYLWPARVEVQSYPVTNGLVRLLPREALFADEDVVVFTPGKPPAIVKTSWQPGSDTLHVGFAPTRSVPLTIWLMGDFGELSDRVQRDLNATNVLWSSNPFGLVLDDVTINDASAHALTSVSCGSVPVEDPSAINVYYSPLANAMGFVGYACSQRRILMRPVIPPGTMLLAHELGHAFGLGHVEDRDNFMHPIAIGGKATIGQIYRAHFASWSALNLVYRFRPSEELRCCAISETFHP